MVALTTKIADKSEAMETIRMTTTMTPATIQKMKIPGLQSDPKISLKNNSRFTGTTTLSIRGSLRQELTTSIGLCIHPSIESRFADCQIILDLVVVRTSSLYSDGNESFPETGPPNHFYITEEATIIIGACGGYCDPPVSLHPLPQHFAERHTTSTRAQLDVSIEASANPKFIVKGSKGSGKSVDFDPVTLALEPTFIGTAARNAFQWQYKPLGSYRTNIELSSRNPPTHEATYRIFSSETPESLRVVAQAIYRKQGKLG